MPKKLPRYPIYILSKGRAKTRLTMKALEKLGIPYYVAVEEHEYDEYCKYEKFGTVLKMPFSNHGKGGGPARNWCWDHSMAMGFKRHWLMDDNIYEFWRWHLNRRYRIESGSAFLRAPEDFVDRYENIYLAGLQYKFFCVDNYFHPPYILNTRIMSCFLIQNDCPHRWRARYNEDVDLSLRVLKDGGVTCLFYAFLCGKARTGTVKGGNTEEIYGDKNELDVGGTFEKSKMLADLHPDVVKMETRYGRIHHTVDITPFRDNKLIWKQGTKIENQGPNNYGLKMVRNFGKEDQFIQDPPQWRK